jgi:hypothetical protein
MIGEAIAIRVPLPITHDASECCSVWSRRLTKATSECNALTRQKRASKSKMKLPSLHFLKVKSVANVLGAAHRIEAYECRDVIRYWDKLNEGYECVLASRFIRGSTVVDYLKIRLLLNRLANHFIRVIFSISLNETTNAFKAYRKELIDRSRPFIAPHFNMTIEIPVKAIIPGYFWVTTPIASRDRRTGIPKTQDQGNGQPLPFHLPLRLAREIFQPRRLPQRP